MPVTMQHFVIFYPENKENDTLLKLANTYMNRLCIDENDENEVVEINQWKTVKNFDHALFLPKLTLKYVKFLNFLLYNNLRSLLEALGLFIDVEKFISFKMKKFDGIRSLHFIYAYSMNELTINALGFLTNRFNSECNFTFLQGRLENIGAKSISYITHLTIGDDIELMINQLKNKTFAGQSESSMVFETVNEERFQMNCIRSFYSYDQIEKFFTSSMMYFVRRTFFILSLFLLPGAFTFVFNNMNSIPLENNTRNIIELILYTFSTLCRWNLYQCLLIGMLFLLLSLYTDPILFTQVSRSSFGYRLFAFIFVLSLIFIFFDSISCLFDVILAFSRFVLPFVKPQN